MASERASPARRGPLDEAERAAIEASHLGSLPPEVLAGLTADAARLRVPAGSILHREGTTSPHFDIVMSGLAVDALGMATSKAATDSAVPCEAGAVEALASTFRGELVRRGTRTYDRHRRVWLRSPHGWWYSTMTAQGFAREREWARGLWTALEPYHTGVYVNVLMEEGEDRVRQAYGAAK